MRCRTQKPPLADSYLKRAAWGQALTTMLACMATAFVISGFAYAEPAPSDFTEKEVALLKNGKPVFRPLPTSRNNGFYGGTGFAIINAPMDVIWKAIQDWASYPKTYPNTIHVEEVSRKGNRHLIKMELGHKLLRITYFVEVEFDKKQRKIKFNLVTNRVHDIDASQGYWRFFPQKNGSTLVAYVVAVRVPMGVINLLSESVERKLEGGLLNIPTRLKRWIEGSNGTRYR